MAETASTKVIRNIVLEKFSPDTLKLFKEIAVDLHYVSLILSAH